MISKEILENEKNVDITATITLQQAFCFGNKEIKMSLQK